MESQKEVPMRTTLLATFCILLLFSVSCDQDGETNLNPTQKTIQSLLEELHTADEEVAAYYQQHSNYPDHYTKTDSGTTFTRTYSAYVNANSVTITGTDTFTGNPPPSAESNYGKLDMTFSGGSIGTATQFILEVTFPKNAPPICTKCTLDGQDVTSDATEMDLELEDQME